MGVAEAAAQYMIAEVVPAIFLGLFFFLFPFLVGSAVFEARRKKLSRRATRMPLAKRAVIAVAMVVAVAVLSLRGR